MSKLYLLPYLLLNILGPHSPAQSPQLLSGAELTGFAETTRYDEVIRFISELQKRTNLITLSHFGNTFEGRRIPLLVLSKPMIHNPTEALASGKPIVLVLANIHGGEVDGKEAFFPLMREILFGQLQHLLDKIVLLVIPIYNADGNEKINRRNRISQNGPINGVGLSENSQGLNLNRDYMKLEAPESNALVQSVLNRWDPHLLIDCHTTNGSYHGYALTFAPPLNPNSHPSIIAYERNYLLPTVMTKMFKDYGYLTYYFGDFVDNENPSRGWRTFDHRPRFGTNYYGLRNRFAILSEAYSYLDFERRVDVTCKFIMSILEYVAENSEKIIDVLRDVDNETVRRGLNAQSSDRLGIQFGISPLPDSVVILVGEVDTVNDQETGMRTFRRKDKILPTVMLDYGLFRWTKTVPIPTAYIFGQDNAGVIEKLLAHGISLEVLEDTLATEVEVFIADSLWQGARPVEKHMETRLAHGVMTVEKKVFLPGTCVASMAQPRANLLFYLLEPESEDGFVNWGLYDETLMGQRKSRVQIEYPVYRLRDSLRAPRHVFLDSNH